MNENKFIVHKIFLGAIILAAIFLMVNTLFQKTGDEVVIEKTISAPEFKGKIARSYEESVEWWPEPVEPKEGTPNVIIFLLDDVGFAQIGSFGGLIETPNIDRIACYPRATTDFSV